MAVTINASNTSGFILNSDTSGELQLQTNGTPRLTVGASGTTTVANLSATAYTPTTSLITSGTAVNSTSGTSITFTGIPSWVRRITVMFNGVSTNGTSFPLIQLGDAGGVETTGYLGSATRFGASTLSTGNYTAGFTIPTDSAAYLYQGFLTINNVSGNVWACSGVIGVSGSTISFIIGSTKGLSDTLDRVRITTVNGTDAFDAGSINILYE
jgi:hypothetical protein